MNMPALRSMEVENQMLQPGKIGVVTVLYNSRAVLPEFMASLDAQTYRNFVVYCVDNASGDHCSAMCKGRGGQYVVIENAQNEGVARGNNQGIDAALHDGCEYILLLNNDVVFESTLFQELVEGLVVHHADMATPLIYYHHDRDLIWCAGGKFSPLYGKRGEHFGIGEKDRGQFSSDQQVDYSPTCCVLVQGSLFHRVGLMDERYFVYWDDSDWMLRAKRAGARLWFLAKPKLWHKVSSLTEGTYSDFGTRYGRRNNAYYHFKHLPLLIACAFTAVYCSYFIVSMLLPKLRHRAGLSLRSWWEGIRLYRKASRMDCRATDRGCSNPGLPVAGE